MPKALYILGPAFLFTISIPLVLFASITSALAFSILTLRVVIVYLELGFAVLSNWISPEILTDPLKLPKLQLSPLVPFKPVEQKRDSHIPGGKTSPRERPARQKKKPTKSESFASLVGNVGPTRDFEGIGGWRESDDREDALWMSMNSRLELPSGGGEIGQRRHKRSLSSQSHTFGRTAGSFKMTSPAYSRNRSPLIADEGESVEGYFANVHQRRNSSDSAAATNE